MPLTQTETPQTTELLAPGGYADRLIRRRAKRLAGMHLFVDMEQEDIEQELNLRLLKRLRNYDPERSSIKTFVTSSIRYETKELIRTRYGAKHIHRRQTRSLDANVVGPANPGLRLKDLVSRSEQVRGSGRTVEDEQQQLELRHDLESVMAKMPPDLRTAIESLLTAKRPANAKKRLPPRVLQAIERHFADAGLQFYL